MPLTDTTRRRVRRNHERVRSLIGLAGMMIHTAAEEDMGQDVLRAATVLLHASLDDFIRTVAKENWSSLSQERLKSVPLPSRKPGEKISFLDLLRLQGQAVDDVVREAVFTYLDGTSFSEKHQITNVLRELGVPDPGPKADGLRPLMERRHHIVHQADKDTAATDSEKELPLAEQTVELWLKAVEHVCNHVIGSLE